MRIKEIYYNINITLKVQVPGEISLHIVFH